MGSFDAAYPAPPLNLLLSILFLSTPPLIPKYRQYLSKCIVTYLYNHTAWCSVIRTKALLVSMETCCNYEVVKTGKIAIAPYPHG
jgi:hypothetical protein